ncbi:MAG: aldehyde dehydrogenase family protein, partial [Acidimicrobiales bacterium]
VRAQPGRPQGGVGHARPLRPRVRGRAPRALLQGGSGPGPRPGAPGPGYPGAGGPGAGGGTSDGWFVRPVLVDGLKPEDRLAQEEVFGPFCLVLAARDDDEAIAVTNGVRYGLVTSVFTRDLDRALDLVERVDTGLVKVNAATSGVDFYAPFGGEKASSFGPREQGKAARDFYTTTQTVTLGRAGPPR